MFFTNNITDPKFPNGLAVTIELKGDSVVHTPYNIKWITPINKLTDIVIDRFSNTLVQLEILNCPYTLGCSNWLDFLFTVPNTNLICKLSYHFGTPARSLDEFVVTDNFNLKQNNTLCQHLLTNGDFKNGPHTNGYKNYVLTKNKKNPNTNWAFKI
eukprot:Pgem_evm1s5525